MYLFEIPLFRQVLLESSIQLEQQFMKTHVSIIKVFDTITLTILFGISSLTADVGHHHL